MKKFYQKSLAPEVPSSSDGQSQRALDLKFEKKASSDHPYVMTMGIASQFLKLLVPTLVGRNDSEKKASIQWKDDSHLILGIEAGYFEFLGGSVAVEGVMKNFRSHLNTLEDFMSRPMASFSHDEWRMTKAFAKIGETACGYKLASLAKRHGIKLEIGGKEFPFETDLIETVRELQVQRKSVARVASINLDANVGTICINPENGNSQHGSALKFRLADACLIESLLANRAGAEILYKPAVDLVSKEAGQLHTLLIEDVGAI